MERKTSEVFDVDLRKIIKSGRKNTYKTTIEMNKKRRKVQVRIQQREMYREIFEYTAHEIGQQKNRKDILDMQECKQLGLEIIEIYGVTLFKTGEK